MTFYWNGDKVRYTGKSEMLHGAMCYEAILLEGHRMDERIWTYRIPAS